MKKIVTGTALILLLCLIAGPGILLGAEQPAPVPRQPGYGYNCGGTGPGVTGGYGFASQVADVLGLNVNDVVESFRAGQSYAEIAEVNKIQRSDFIAKLIQNHQTRLAEAVEEGYLTPEQAEWRQENLTARIADLVDYRYDDNSPRGRGWGGIGRGHGRGFNRSF
ncbi:MAG: hypothetical protein ACOWWO_10285 [Peptococcaceae bacterium]